MATRRTKSSAKDRFATATQTAAAMHVIEQEVTAQIAIEREQASFVTLDSIVDRRENTRELNQRHVENLAESIGILGLLEPLVVDQRLRLLAGGHRKAAIYILRLTFPDRYKLHFSNDQVPIRVMPFDAENEPDKALQCEVAENEKRRDYSPAEIKVLAERLKAAGFKELKGRPRKGQKALMPALSVVVGKSIRRIQQYLEVPPQRSMLHSTPKLEKSTKLFVLLKSAQRSVERSRQLVVQIPESDRLQETIGNALAQVEIAMEQCSQMLE
jgi:ParB family transcriptional regulator, chromosome partitioning protein